MTVQVRGGGALYVLPPRTSPDEASIQQKFEAFDAANPQVYAWLVKLAFEWRDRRGPHTRCGVSMLWERMRWEMTLSTTGSAFKLNNDYRSRYVRKLVDEHPMLAGMFETRRLRAA